LLILIIAISIPVLTYQAILESLTRSTFNQTITITLQKSALDQAMPNFGSKGYNDPNSLNFITTMLHNEIRIPRKLANQLLHQAQLSPETEICGFIGSKNATPVSCYPVNNIAELPEQRFLFDPEQQIAAMKIMREAKEDLFAIYHSHPKAPALPSHLDLALAAYPEAYYLIISLNTKGVLEMRAFKIQQQTACEVAILVFEA
jgi:proteasome lid subunit RPN8/RPN11